MSDRHHSTYAPFCPGISTTPSIDYSRVAPEAMATYPGAGDQVAALVLMVKHQQMRVSNAIAHYSAEAHDRDARAYAAGWIDRYLHDAGISGYGE